MGLTGLDNQPTTISTPKATRVRHSDKDFKTVADKILDDDDLKEVSFKSIIDTEIELLQLAFLKQANLHHFSCLSSVYLL